MGPHSMLEGCAKDNRNGTAAILGFLFLLLGAIASGAPFSAPTRLSIDPSISVASASGFTSTISSGTYFDYVLIIVMENHAICDILTSCGGTGTYMTTFASAHGLATKYVDCNRPSLPNYLCLAGGQDFGCGGYDGNPHSNTCTNLAWKSKNIVDLLVNASLTWKAYMEDMPSNCYGSNSGRYAVRHDPFVYFSNIVNNGTRCSRVVPAGSGDSALLNDLASTSTASNYMWLTPNLCNDMHDCSVATGDTYLKGLLPQILNSTVFATTRAALLIAFDEDSGGKGAPYMYTVWAGPTAKTTYTSAAAYNHFSVLSTLELNWNLPYLTSHDQGAPNMSEFFTTSSKGPTARFTYSPAWPQANANVTFDASASSDSDPNATLQFRWDWTNDGTWDTPWNGTPTAGHPYAAEGTYTCHLEVQDSFGFTANATHTVVVDSTPPNTAASLSGTTGSNGWYRSSVKVTLTATDPLSGVASTFYRVDAGAWKKYTAAVTVGGDGSHTVDYNSTDRAGNVETIRSTPFKLDTIAPSTAASLSGTLGGNGTYYVGPVNVTLTATDATSGVASTTYRVDGGPSVTYISTFTVSGNGTHTVAFSATDNAGNVETTKNVVVQIGKLIASPPTTTLDVNGSSGTNGWYVTSSTATLNATSPSGSAVSIEYRLDGGPWSAYTAPLALGDGVHVVDYNATDANGMKEATKTATVRVDSIAPALWGLEPSGRSSTSNVTISWRSSDGGSGLSRFEMSVDGAPFQSIGMSSSLSLNLPDGGHNVWIRAIDVAGNVATQVVSFRVDTNPFSLTGPYYGVPLLLLILVPIWALIAGARRRRRRRRARASQRSIYVARQPVYNGKR